MIIVIDYVFIERLNKFPPPTIPSRTGIFNFSTPVIAFHIQIICDQENLSFRSHYPPLEVSMAHPGWLCLYANYRFSSYLAWNSAHARSLII